MATNRHEGHGDSTGRESDQLRFGLCLSGGGFRATFFHLGVLRALRDLDLLSRVHTICSVSGGSVVAAHACVHWDRYSATGDDQMFFASTAPLAELGLRDVRGRCVRRAMLLGALPKFRIAPQLEASYAGLLGGRSLADLPMRAPELHILATSLTSGALVDFGRHGITFSDRSASDRSADRTETFDASTLPLARAVAASAAFPPLVPPTPLRRRELHATTAEFPHTEYLTDGGIFDNLGLHRMSELARESDPGIVVISDASAAFDWRVGQQRWGPIARNVRASSIVMSRVSQLESWIATAPGTSSVFVEIGDTASSDEFPEGARHLPQSVDVQRACRFVRTDLDAFTLEEIQALVRHGYECGVKVLHEYAPQLNPAAITDPTPAGWPHNVSLIDMTRRLGGLVDLVEQVDESNRRVAEAKRRIFEEPVTEEAIEGERERDDEARQRASELARVVQRLEESASRQLRLWSASDPISWATLAVLVLAVSLVVGFVWPV